MTGIFTAEALANALLAEISDRRANGGGVGRPRGYYTFGGASDDPPDLTDVGLDGTDDLVAVCEGALRRLGS